MAEDPDTKTRTEVLADTLQRKAERKRKAEAERRYGLWFGLGMFGLVGWSVTVPTVLGVALGVWLDKQDDGSVSWVLTFLFVGLAGGCLNAWYWVKREIERT